MSRHSDEGENNFPNEGALFWANCQRALKGKRGKRDLRELLNVLEALPEKRLVYGHLVKEGEVCTVGALIVARHVAKGEERAAVLARLEEEYSACECYHRLSDHGPEGCERCRQNYKPEYSWSKLCPAYHYSEFEDDGDEDAHSTSYAATEVGVTYSLAWYLSYVNDELYADASPEERYEKVRGWIHEQLQPEAVPA